MPEYSMLQSGPEGTIPAKPGKPRGIDPFILVSIIFVAATVLVFSLWNQYDMATVNSIEEAKELQGELQELREEFAVYEAETELLESQLPADVLESLLYKSQLNGSMRYLGMKTVGNDTIGILVDNTGDMVLSNFEYEAGGHGIEPMVRLPPLFFPGRLAMVVLQPYDWRTIKENETILISSSQGVVLRIFALNETGETQFIFY